MASQVRRVQSRAVCEHLKGASFANDMQNLMGKENSNPLHSELLGLGVPMKVVERGPLGPPQEPSPEASGYISGIAR